MIRECAINYDRQASLTIGISCGVSILIYLVVSADAVGGDLAIYYDAMTNYAKGISIYQDISAGRFVYPPSVIPVFYPLTWFPTKNSAYFASVIINILASVLTAFLTIRTVRSINDVTFLDSMIIYLFFILSTYPVLNSMLGNINQILMLLFGLIFVTSRSGKTITSSGLLSAAINLKLFPFVLIIYYFTLTERSRYFYSVIAALVATTLLGIIILGFDIYMKYIKSFRSGGVKTSFLDIYGPLPVNSTVITLARPIKAIFPWVGKIEYMLISVSIFVTLSAILERKNQTLEGKLSLFLFILGMIIIIIPPNLVYPVLLYFPLLSLLFILDAGIERFLLSAGTSLMSLMFLPSQLQQAMVAFGIPGNMTNIMTGLFESILTFGTIPLYGIIIIMISCTIVMTRENAC